jgi:hypothetical protein
MDEASKRRAVAILVGDDKQVKAVAYGDALGMARTPGPSVETSSKVTLSLPTARPRYDYDWRRFRVYVFRAYRIPHEQWRNYTIHMSRLSLGTRQRICSTFGRSQKLTRNAKMRSKTRSSLRRAIAHAYTEIRTSRNRAQLDRYSFGAARVREHHYAGEEQ